ncbi:MAG TPA: acVLRF1 family peptidyl-tRNA hydrolase [Streptosporangiaceae bacterium]|nr:acVLRF1 family peptidyl-tRNA hydrolase [Streptosporangiaceae bacterium]
MSNGADRRLEVPPERIARWLTGFGERHGGVTEVTAGPDTVRYVAADGSRAECRVPFPPLEGELAEHALRDRRVGVLLARLGGYAAGVFEGDRLVASKVGSRLVHGRSAAGGWSQHRFARRREKQAREALQDAADVAVRILTPQLAELDAVVLGGDRAAIEVLREDPRLAKVFGLAVEPFLTVPDPRLAVLRETPPKFRAVRILLHEPS